jgi:predicted metalloprotease
MDAVWQVIYADGQESAGGLDMSRRKELQAQCFSGMFLGSTANRGGTVTQSVFDVAWNDQATRGDNTSGSHDHGTNAHYAAWWRKGAESDRLAQCNTFAAPASDVS